MKKGRRKEATPFVPTKTNLQLEELPDTGM